MPTRLYQFHCVGDGDAVFDSAGRRLTTVSAMRAHADRVALSLMARADTDWTRWIVDVRDSKGRQVLVRAFTDARETAQPAG